MPERENGQTEPSDAVRARPARGSGTSMHALIAVCAILYLGAAATGVFVAVSLDEPKLGLLGLVVVLSTAPMCAVLLARKTDFARANDPRTSDGDPETRAAIESLRRSIQELSDKAAMSDESRRILSRQADQDILRRAIEEELTARNWDAAMVLIKDLAERHGLRQEAESYRNRIDTARSPTQDSDVQSAIVQLDELITQRRWELAFADAARITRLYPDSPRVDRLRERVEQARAAYKAELERRFLIAARDERINEAMETLKLLDEFLTEVEAEPYRELARGIITRARENLGAEFKLAVQDRRWQDAASLGGRIIEEFPNSRMAAEVRELIDGIRERAASLAVAAPVQSPPFD